jgi:hypothetical protein
MRWRLSTTGSETDKSGRSLRTMAGRAHGKYFGTSSPASRASPDMLSTVGRAVARSLRRRRYPADEMKRGTTVALPLRKVAALIFSLLSSMAACADNSNQYTASPEAVLAKITDYVRQNGGDGKISSILSGQLGLNDGKDAAKTKGCSKTIGEKPVIGGNGLPEKGTTVKTISVPPEAGTDDIVFWTKDSDELTAFRTTRTGALKSVAAAKRSAGGLFSMSAKLAVERLHREIAFWIGMFYDERLCKS